LLAWSRQSRCHLGRQGGAGRLAQHIHFGWCCNGLVGNCAATPLLRMSGMGVLQPWLVLTPPGPWSGWCGTRFTTCADVRDGTCVLIAVGHHASLAECCLVLAARVVPDNVSRIRTRPHSPQQHPIHVSLRRSVNVVGGA